MIATKNLLLTSDVLRLRPILYRERQLQTIPARLLHRSSHSLRDMDETIQLPTIGTWHRSLAEIKNCIAQVERVAEQARRVAKEYGKTDADKEAWCLTIFHRCLRADVKNWFEDLDVEIQEDWEWMKEEFFYWFGETSQQQSYRTEFQSRVRTMQQGTRKAGEYLRICKAMGTLTTDKYLVFLAAQAFVNGLNSHKVRQELEDILPKGRYDFQDIESAFRKLRSRYEAKKSLAVPLQVLGGPATISVGAVLEVSPIAAYQPMSNSTETTLEVPEPQEQHSGQASQYSIQQQPSIRIQQRPDSTTDLESNEQKVSSSPAQYEKPEDDQKVVPYPPHMPQDARQQAQAPLVPLQPETRSQVPNDSTRSQVEVDSEETIQLLQQPAGNEEERRVMATQQKPHKPLPPIQDVVGCDCGTPSLVLAACGLGVEGTYDSLLSRSQMENPDMIEGFRKEFTIAGIYKRRIGVSPTSEEVLEEYVRIDKLGYIEEDREEQESRKGIG